MGVRQAVGGESKRRVDVDVGIGIVLILLLLLLLKRFERIDRIQSLLLHCIAGGRSTAGRDTRP